LAQVNYAPRVFAFAFSLLVPRRLMIERGLSPGLLFIRGAAVSSSIRILLICICARGARFQARGASQTWLSTP